MTSYASYSLPFDASWQPDFWGRIRNTVDANVLAAQASAADLENVRLTMQAEVAVDYFELRAQDALEASCSTRPSPAIRIRWISRRFSSRAGIASDEAVAQAETQLNTTQAQDTDLGILRAQFEHALARLVGQPASTFSLPVQPLRRIRPSIPFARSGAAARAPSGRRRSKSAMVAAANAQIGIARAAFYPNVTLSASAGFGTTSIARLVYLAQPFLVRRSVTRGNALRCRPCAALRCSSIRRCTIRTSRTTVRRS